MSTLVSWCYVVHSRDVGSRDFSRPLACSNDDYQTFVHITRQINRENNSSNFFLQFVWFTYIKLSPFYCL